MSRTGLTVVTALVMIVLSVLLMVGRWQALGSEIDGTPGTAVWIVSLEVEGELVARRASVTTVLPPDFRRQHIIDEKFSSQQLAHTVRTGKDGGQRRAVWGPRPGAGGPSRSGWPTRSAA